MGFEALLGNARLKENLTASLRRGQLSHFYLISGPTGAGKKTLAKLLAAGAMCQEAEKPCLQCPACRKVLHDAHPDVFALRDPEHKTVPVRMVRDLREDVFIRPNEGTKKVYIFPQELGTEGQNALLKILEEPPAYGLFLLISENPEKILTTVRSRCVELPMAALPEDVLIRELSRRYPKADPEAVSAAAFRSGGWLGQAQTLLEEGTDHSPQTKAFLQAFSRRDVLQLVATLVKMEKWGREEVIRELNTWIQLLQSALTSRSQKKGADPLAQALGNARTQADILKAVQALQKATLYARGNVSVAAVSGWLQWQLR